MNIPRPLIALALVIAFGIAKMPVEHALTKAQAQAGFARINMNLNLRTQIGQNGFVAALGGFRSLVANLVWLEAHTAWEKTQWEKMRLLFDTVTTLQPRTTMFWDMAAWHMAWNASVDARRDPKIPLDALRIRAQRHYFAVGEDFLRRGIQNNPEKSLLYEKLGMLLRDKMEDHCGAAEAFRQGASKQDAMPYVKRFVAYELSRCPGKEKEAYAELMRLYNMGKDQHLPTLIVQIKEMEQALNIPADQWIKDPHPDDERARRSPSAAPAPPLEGGMPALPGTAPAPAAATAPAEPPHTH